MRNLTLPSTLSIVLVFAGICSFSQVKEIKSASRGGGGRGEGSYSSGSSVAFDVFFYSFDGIAQWQRQILTKRDSIPWLVSFEASLLAAIQPSSYYIVNPRFRGNWGLFSTDIRINYLVEEAVEGPIHIRTVDWQIIQMNVVTTKDVTFRLGAGVMHESYGYQRDHLELTAGLQLIPGRKRIGGTVEYRAAEVRKEINGGLVYELATIGRTHWYTTIGAAYQRYYSSIDVWGFQAGLTFKFF